MPIIQIELLKGRTVLQKEFMVKKVTQALVDTVNCNQEDVRIIIREMDKENYSIGGKLMNNK